jgi:hypothetical protein
MAHVLQQFQMMRKRRASGKNEGDSSLKQRAAHFGCLELQKGLFLFHGDLFSFVYNEDKYEFNRILTRWPDGVACHSFDHNRRRGDESE